MRLSLLLLVACALALGTASSASAKVVWLCSPTLKTDPCRPGLSTTSYAPNSSPIGTSTPKAVAKPKVDCFYVYPTVSDQKRTLATKRIDPEERSIALYQAARYSQRCRVFAPMYRQVTLQTLNSGRDQFTKQLPTGIADVREAFKQYLRKENKGRPFVLIGHSQGTYVLRSLIAKDVDRRPAVRKRLLSAYLLGGNVTQGEFTTIKPCRAGDSTPTGCLVAFSTFDQPVPADSRFGRAAAGGKPVVCVNPSSLTAGPQPLDTIVPSAPFAPGTSIALGNALLKLTIPQPATTWVHYPNAYVGRCTKGAAHVLQVTTAVGGQVPNPSPDPTWGLHLLDANIALGNLVDLLGDQTAAFTRNAAGRRG